MNMIEIEKHVDRLFEADRKAHYRQCSFVPILGWGYVPGDDNVRRQKRIACAALAAREWFYANGPADLQPLPLNYSERESLKGGGAGHILAWYARSMEGRDYNYSEHPLFDDYAYGVMASQFAPDFIKNDPELLKRFPPRALNGLGPGLYWDPPKPVRQPAKSSRRKKNYKVTRSRALNS